MTSLLAGDRLQIVLIIGMGFLLSRLLVRTGAGEALMLRLLRKAGGDPARLSLLLILSASLLSSFIPNAITVLTLLPVLKLLIKRLGLNRDTREQKGIATYLTCSLIWGANIGGNSSIIGSPANILLLAFLEIYQTPGREALGFVTWLAWGIPLVLALDLGAWLVGRLFFRRLGTTAEAVPAATSELGPAAKATAWLTLGLLVFSAVVSTLSLLMRSAATAMTVLNLSALAFAAFFVWLIFASNPWTRRLGVSGALLQPSDCWKQLPWRGLLFAGAVVAVFGGAALWAETAGFKDALQTQIAQRVPSGTSPLTVLFLFVVAAIYLTEFLSNSLVSTAFFYGAGNLAATLQVPLLPLFVGIGMASTCAFMTPVATPVNSLAIGEIRGLSLSRMMAAGFILNLLSALLITATAGFVVPVILGLH